MKREGNHKQMLFEMMEKVNPDFNSNESNIEIEPTMGKNNFYWMYLTGHNDMVYPIKVFNNQSDAIILAKKIGSAIRILDATTDVDVAVVPSDTDNENEFIQQMALRKNELIKKRRGI
jgi:hypothetical protein